MSWRWPPATPCSWRAGPTTGLRRCSWATATAGTRSVDSDTFLALPHLIKNVTIIIEIFDKVGLDVHDMVALSGGHKLGRALRQLQGPATGRDGDAGHVASQVAGLHLHGRQLGHAPFDWTNTRFDGVYREMTARRGLLSSDQTLFESPETKEIVSMFAMKPDYFYSFQQGMRKMGQINLKEGDEGEIRKTCRVINS
ncbi:peroxidase 47-like [Panicum miliaceum]|uniref:Peroxidase 47-like n=1 Tax=Panicum miliaceum TaxID=4540 RepID=A0A3L6SI52_PANMI|nr:peroxidase 47-like [Panicum miliaceum]